MSKVLIQRKSKDHDPIKRDAVELAVRFYDNRGALKQVEMKSGVPVNKLRRWMDGGELSATNRQYLINAMSGQHKETNNEQP